MYYVCDVCNHQSSGNKRSCRKCKSKKWLLVDDDGMVNIDIEFSPEEYSLLRKATGEKYGLQRVSEKHMQRFIEEMLTDLAEDIQRDRDLRANS